MAEWLHCNVCSLRYAANIKLFLTECGHLTCEKCVVKLKETRKCVVCGKSTTPMQLSKDMVPSVYEFFLPLDDHLKKILEIYNFQKQHKDRLQQILIQKYNYAKKECINCHTVSKQLMKENKMLRTMLKQSCSGSKSSFLASTPLGAGQPPVNTSIDNMSVASSTILPSIWPGYARRVSSAEKGPFPMHQSVFSGGSVGSGPSPAQMVPNAPKGQLAGLHKSLGPKGHLRAPYGQEVTRKGPPAFPNRK